MQRGTCSAVRLPSLLVRKWWIGFGPTYMEGCRWGITQRVSDFQINVWERGNDRVMTGMCAWLLCDVVKKQSASAGMRAVNQLSRCACLRPWRQPASAWVFVCLLLGILKSPEKDISFKLFEDVLLKCCPENWKLDICRLRIHRNCICIACCSCILKHTGLTCVLCAWQGESAALPEEPEAESCWLVPLETFITGAVQHDLLHRYANTQSAHKTSMFSESVISDPRPDRSL